jgi:hypothetical protein
MCENIPINKDMNNYVNYVLSKNSFKENNDITQNDIDNVIESLSDKKRLLLCISIDIESIKLIRWIAICWILGKNSSYYEKKLHKKLNKYYEKR